MTHPATETAHSPLPTGDEITAMAHVLARRYAGGSVNVALHFAAEHEAVADAPRAAVWHRVADELRRRFPAPTLS
jgi:hypothetical protein